jgi:protease II
MEKCAMSPYIKNSAGKIVESKLFNDLFSTFKSRGKAWKYYGIATNPKFLNSIKEQISLDSNGEITMESFFRVASVRTQGDQAITLLEKSLGLKNETYSYDEAVATINSFNRHNTEHPGYMATMVETKDGNYDVHIVQRNSQNKEYLKQTIKDKLIKEKITEHLNKAGVAVNLSASSSHYLVGQNIEKTVNGLCELIDFCVDDFSDHQRIRKEKQRIQNCR